MAEYLIDFDIVDEVFEFDGHQYLVYGYSDFTTRLFLEWDLDTITNRLDQAKGQKNVIFLHRVLFIMLSDTYNNNLIMSVAKTITFSERNVTLTLLTCPRSWFRGCRLERSHSILDQFQVLSPLKVRAYPNCKTWIHKKVVNLHISVKNVFKKSIETQFL